MRNVILEQRHFPFVLCFITMPIRSTMKGESFSSAHTWGKCSFVTEIIQHVEYSVPMARVAEIAQNATAHWGNLLTPTVTSDAQLISPVCAGLYAIGHE
jgi:hypothetical protein